MYDTPTCGTLWFHEVWNEVTALNGKVKLSLKSRTQMCETLSCGLQCCKICLKSHKQKQGEQGLVPQSVTTTCDFHL